VIHLQYCTAHHTASVMVVTWPCCESVTRYSGMALVSRMSGLPLASVADQQRKLQVPSGPCASGIFRSALQPTAVVGFHLRPSVSDTRSRFYFSLYRNIPGSKYGLRFRIWICLQRMPFNSLRFSSIRRRSSFGVTDVTYLLLTCLIGQQALSSYQLHASNGFFQCLMRI
jgi:hypothetical protein